MLGVFASSIGGALGFQLFLSIRALVLEQSWSNKNTLKMSCLQVLKFDIQNTGFLSALPSVLSMTVKFICGPL